MVNRGDYRIEIHLFWEKIPILGVNFGTTVLAKRISALPPLGTLPAFPISSPGTPRPDRQERDLMTEAQPNLFTRGDTFFGVCEALGEDLGIHSNWLRLGFAGIFFLAPVAVVTGYLALGVIIALTRRLVPNPVRPRSVQIEQSAEAAPAAETVPMAANETEALPLAA